jgi:hypothetical protein
MDGHDGAAAAAAVDVGTTGGFAQGGSAREGEELGVSGMAPGSNGIADGGDGGDGHDHDNSDSDEDYADPREGDDDDDDNDGKDTAPAGGVAVMEGSLNEDVEAKARGDGSEDERDGDHEEGNTVDDGEERAAEEEEEEVLDLSPEELEQRLADAAEAKLRGNALFKDEGVNLAQANFYHATNSLLTLGALRACTAPRRSLLCALHPCSHAMPFATAALSHLPTYFVRRLQDEMSGQVVHSSHSTQSTLFLLRCTKIGTRRQKRTLKLSSCVRAITQRELHSTPTELPVTSRCVHACVGRCFCLRVSVHASSSVCVLVRASVHASRVCAC